MFFFFFKQKTAYEMRISDWSSDVCSSDLASPEETTATLAADAGRAAIAAAGVAAQDVDLIVLATATPDQTFPSSATKVQAMLGIDDCVAFDVAAVCSGFLYAVQEIGRAHV